MRRSPSLKVQRCERGLGHGDVLLDRSGACSDRADDGAVRPDGEATAENHHMPRIGLLDPVERRAGLGELGQLLRRLLEQARACRLAERKVDASREGAILPGKGQ
jgi:hypothetical protein